jgi:dUTP pyrophosphatase
MTSALKTLLIQIKKLSHASDLPLPSYATLHSAGMDLLAAIEESVVIAPMKRFLVPTGIAIALPEGYEAQVRSRSGLAYKHGISVINSPGTIDSDYRGEIFVPLINLSDEKYMIERGMRIAQMIISQFTTVSWNITDNLDVTIRNNAGFGSTGV